MNDLTFIHMTGHVLGKPLLIRLDCIESMEETECSGTVVCLKGGTELRVRETCSEIAARLESIAEVQE